MTGGIWLDLVLAALIVAVAIILYRMLTARSVTALAAAGGEEDVTPEPRRGLARLRGYYPRLARQAGFEPSSLVWVYWLAKIGLAVLLPLLTLEIWGRWGSGPGLLILVLLALLGFFVPDLWLLGVRRGRRRRIRMALSYYLDLMVSLLTSGLGLEESFRRAAREGMEQSHPLALEARIVDLELGAGKERSEAFDALAERTGVREFSSVAAALRLGLRLGNPVQETLSAQADLLRARRREDARRQISLAPLKTLVPILLCGFPIFLVLVIFPAAVDLFDVIDEVRALLARL